MNERENYIRTVRFGTPDYIPIHVHINESMWTCYGKELLNVTKKYPHFFNENDRKIKPLLMYDEEKFFDTSRQNKDAWGCMWAYPIEGMDGIVTEFPLSDWDNLKNYKFPDPAIENDRSKRDWAQEEENIIKTREMGKPTFGSLAHGFMLLRLTYLRGFENALCDLLDDDEHMQYLIDGIEKHSAYIVKRYLEMGVDVMEFPEDLGTQTSSFISPELMEKWVFPVYKRLMQPVRDAGKLVGFHSDGRVLDILPGLIRSGVDIVNPQDLVNGIDNLAREIKGRACIRLDVDRQSIVPYGTPKEVEELIEAEIKILGSKKGGLEIIVGVYPPTPLENLDAMCRALTKYQRWWNE